MQTETQSLISPADVAELDKIYGATTKSSTLSPEDISALDTIYGVTQQPIASQTKEPGFLASIGNAIADPFIALGGGVQNAIRAGGRAVGFDTPAQTELPSVFGGTVDPVGYRDGQELGALDTAQQFAGNFIILITYFHF